MQMYDDFLCAHTHNRLLSRMLDIIKNSYFIVPPEIRLNVSGNEESPESDLKTMD